MCLCANISFLKFDIKYFYSLEIVVNVTMKIILEEVAIMKCFMKPPLSNLKQIGFMHVRNIQKQKCVLFYILVSNSWLNSNTIDGSA